MTQMLEVRATLARRLAAGEITEEEYDHLLAKLTRPFTDDVSSTLPEAAVLVGLRPEPIAAAMPAAPAAPSGNPSQRGFYLARLWRGQISLASTYWIWGVLVTGSIGGAARFLYPETLTRWQTISVPIVVVLWISFMLVAVFRSANRYQSKRPRRFLGRVVQVAWLIGYPITLANWLPAIPGVADESVLNEQLAKKRKLVGSVRNNIRGDWVVRNSNTFDFGLVALGDAAANITPEVVPAFRRIAALVTCGTADGRQLLFRLDSMHYTYLDEKYHQLAQFSISSADCDGPT